MSKSLLEATLVDPGGSEWSVGVLHLHHGALEADETERDRELDVVLDVFAEHRKRGARHVLAGDFNADSPVQVIEPARCKPRTREEWKANGGHIPRRAIQPR